MTRLAVLPAALFCLICFGSAEAGEYDQDKILAAARAADLEYQRSYELLIQDLANADREVRLRSLRSLSRMQDPQSIPVVLPMLDPAVRSNVELKVVIETLSDLGAVAATAPLQAMLAHKDAEIRDAAHNGLSRIATIAAGDFMRRAKDEHSPLRASSATNLGTLRHAEAATVLTEALAFDSRPHIRRMSAIALGNLGDGANGPALTEALCDSDPGVRRYAAEGLVKLNYTQAIPNLLMALEANVAGAYMDRCLTLLSGQDFGFDTQANILERTAAIERGFVWYGANSKNLH